METGDEGAHAVLRREIDLQNGSALGLDAALSSGGCRSVRSREAITTNQPRSLGDLAACRPTPEEVPVTMTVGRSVFCMGRTTITGSRHFGVN
jgi:hypothetical protein